MSFSKSEIEDFSRKNNIDYREDSSNQNDNYLRNKLRNQFIPNLKSLGENFNTKISTLFSELKETDDFIEHFLSVQKSKLEESNQISIPELNSVPQFMWHRLFSNYGLSRNHRNEILKLTESISGSVFNTPTHILLKNREHIIIKEIEQIKNLSIQVKSNEKQIDLGKSKLTFKVIDIEYSLNFKNNSAYLDLDRIKWPLTVRNWRVGDKMIPFGFKGNKLISKILKDKKLNKFQKQDQLVIESDGKVIWLIDLMISNQFSISEKTTRIIKIDHIQY